MRTFALLAALAWAVAGAAAGPAAAAAASAQPVVVELYTSQGCSACVKANGMVERLGRRKGVLPLTFAVDYWDYLGWTDTFAKPSFTERQRAYMRKLSLREVYTPQVVVDGRAQAAGGQAARIDTLLKEAAKAKPAAPRMNLISGKWVRLDNGRAPRGGAEVWLVRYQPQPDAVEVNDGENRGQAIAYVNVVRDLVRLGSWSGQRKTFALPAADNPDYRSLVMVQGAKGGPILGVLED